MRANDTDGAKEKHVPQVVVDGSTVHVKVGEVAHPMTPEHLIAFIVLVTEKGYQIAPLTAQDAPEATFALVAGDAPVKAYEYCNLHGLWVKETLAPGQHARKGRTRSGYAAGPFSSRRVHPPDAC